MRPPLAQVLLNLESMIGMESGLTSPEDPRSLGATPRAEPARAAPPSAELVASVLSSIARQVEETRRAAVVPPHPTERAELELASARRLWESLLALGYYETELGQGAEAAVHHLERSLARCRAQDAITHRFASLRELDSAGGPGADPEHVLGALQAVDELSAQLEGLLQALGPCELSAHAVRAALLRAFTPDPSLQGLAETARELAALRGRREDEGSPSWARLPRARALLGALHSSAGSEAEATATGAFERLPWAEQARYLPVALVGLEALRLVVEARSGRSLAELMAPPGVRVEDFSPANLAHALRWAMSTLEGEWTRPGFEVRVSSLAQAAVLPAPLRARDPARFAREEARFAHLLQHLKREHGFYREAHGSPAEVRAALERFVARLEG